jgi:hypothetical protein
MPHKRPSRPGGGAPALSRTTTQHTHQDPGASGSKRHRRNRRHEKEQNEPSVQNFISAENVTSVNDASLPTVHDTTVNETSPDANALSQIETRRTHEQQTNALQTDAHLAREETDQRSRESAVAETPSREEANVALNHKPLEPEQTAATEPLVQIETKSK